MEDRCDIKINRLEAACLFSGRSSNREGIHKENQFDQLCKFLDRPKTPFKPKTGQIVGVFCKQPDFKWRRGKVVAVDELGYYKVFLIDYGDYTFTQSKFVTDAGKLTFPPQFIRVCLPGVVPCVEITKDIEVVLMDLFRNSSVYLSRGIESDNNVRIADVTIKKRNEQPQDLKTVLLEKGYVKKSATFLSEMHSLIEKLEDFDDLFTPFISGLTRSPNEQVGLIGGRRSRRSGRKSSSDEEDIAECAPAGYHCQNKPKPKTRRDLRSKSAGRSSKPVQRYAYRSTSCNRRVEPEPRDSGQSDTSPQSVAKQVTWADEESEPETEPQDSAPRRRGFNLNFKAETRGEKKSSLGGVGNQAPSGVEYSATQSPDVVKTENTKMSRSSLSTNVKLQDDPQTTASTGATFASVKTNHTESSRDKVEPTSPASVLSNSFEQPGSRENSPGEILSGKSNLMKYRQLRKEEKERQRKIEESKQSSGSCEMPNSKSPAARSTDLDRVKSTESKHSPNTNDKDSCSDISLTSESAPSFKKSHSVYSSDDSFNRSNEIVVSGLSNLLKFKKEQRERKRLERLQKESGEERENGFGDSPGSRAVQSSSDTSSVISNDNSQCASSLQDNTEDEMRKQMERKKMIDQLMEANPEPTEHLKLEKRSSRTVSYILKMSDGVLLHTRDKNVIPPQVNVGDCLLDNLILKNIEKCGLREMNRVQMYSYPTICAQRNMMIVAEPGGGKTSGYVIPLASNLLNENEYQDLPTGDGARCVVISPYVEKGRQTANMFRSICSKLTVVQTHSGGDKLEMQRELIRGCDVLVSTPRCMKKMLESKLRDLKRLCHIVFDDCEILFEKFKPEVEYLMVLADQTVEKRKTKIGLQVVATSCLWTSQVERFCHIMVEPTICIVNMLEACLYAGLKPIASLVPQAKKLEKLCALLKETDGKKRVLIACRTQKEVTRVSHVLIDMGMRNVLEAHEGLNYDTTGVPHRWSNEDEIKNVNSLWHNKTFSPILVRSDEVIEEVPIVNAQVLIHYDMPVNLKTFSRRFMSLVENYPNILKQESQPNSCQAHIFLDEEDDLPALSVFRFMARLGTVLPPKIENMLEHLEHKREAEKMDQPLCEDLKMFGRCWDKKRCANRHLFCKEIDSTDAIPSVGSVKILVQHVHNACHYSARLVEHKSNNNKWETIPSKMLELSFKLKNYYSVECNRRLIGSAKVGEIAAYELEDTFHRVVILKIATRKCEYGNKNEPVRANIRLIDVGSYHYNVPLVNLYGLPKEWKEVPPSVVDVYLCNLQPKDLDVQWSSSLVKWVNEKLTQARHKNSNGFLIGKIVLRLGDSLWLNPLEYWSYSADKNTTAFHLCLRSELLSCANAIVNPEHIPTLKQLCAKAGIEIREEEVQSAPVRQECKWAWLPQDEVEVVHVVTIEAPDILFVRLSSLTDNLLNLSNEIQSYMENKQNEPEPAVILHVGNICLAKSSDGWNRAMVHNKVSQDQVEVFFVDYGDFATLPQSDVAAIPEEFISKLPFQVIECYLAGVRYKESEERSWEDNVINTICDMTRNPDEESINLQVMVCDVELEGKISKGRRYQVMLLDINNEEVVILNKQLASLSSYATFEENDDLQQKCNSFNKFADETVSSEGEDEENAEDIVEMFTKMQEQCQVELPSEFNINELVTCDEKERRVLEFIRNIEYGDFEDSRVTSFHERLENLHSDKSRSLTDIEPGEASESRSREEKVTIREIQENEELLASDNPSTSEKSSTPNHSNALAVHRKFNPNVSPIDKPSAKFKVVEEECEVLNQDYLGLRVNKSTQSSPAADLSFSETFHTVRTSPCPSHLTPLNVDVSKDSFSKSSSPSPNGSIFSKLKGSVTHFKDMISPTLYESSSSSCNSPGKLNLLDKVKPFVGRLSESFIEEEPQDESVKETQNETSDITFQSCVDTIVDENIAVTDSLTETPQRRWVEAESLLSSTSEENVSVVSDYVGDFDNIKSSTSKQFVEEENLITRCPPVEWYQDDDIVYIFVKLPEVKKYELNCDITWIDFRAEYKGLNYHVRLDLFAGIEPKTVQHSVKPFYFEIKLHKLMRGKRFRWERLLESNEKCLWLRFHQEKGFDDFSDSEDEDVRMEALTRPDGNLIMTDVESLASDATEARMSDFED